jgi:hypothetical protein
MLESIWELIWFSLIILLWVVYFIALFQVFGDLFRSDISGWGKAGWILFIFFLPLLGMLVYLIVHGDDMGKRQMAAAQAQKEAMDTYIQQAAGSAGGAADQIAKAKELLDAGAISQEEFDALKSKALA